MIRKEISLLEDADHSCYSEKEKRWESGAKRGGDNGDGRKKGTPRVERRKREAKSY